MKRELPRQTDKWAVVNGNGRQFFTGNGDEAYVSAFENTGKIYNFHYGSWAFMDEFPCQYVCESDNGISWFKRYI